MKKEKNVNSKEKMIKSCQRLRKIMIGFIWGCAGILIAYTATMTILAISLLIMPEANQKAEFSQQFFQITEDMGTKINDATKNIDKFMESKSSNEGIQFVAGVIGWIILVKIAKILDNIVKKETPFTEENIGNMKKISICATIMWILMTTSIFNVGIIYIFAIWIMYYVFNYGYQLQIESDETL